MRRPQLLVAGLVVVIAISFSPALQPVPARDSGCYLYVATQMLAGGAPYRDAWENKLPMIYFIDAAGLLLGGGSRWGVWALEVLALVAATLLGWGALAREFGPRAATFASLAWVLTLPLVLERGNLTEEFALPLQFAALAIFVRTRGSRLLLRHGFALGVLLAATFLLRQNLIAIALLVGLFLVIRRVREAGIARAAGMLSSIAVGTVVVLVPTAAYLVAAGALDAMLDQTFYFNSLYSDWSLSGRLRGVFEGLRLTMQSGLSFLSLIAWFGTLAVSLVTRRLPSSSLLQLALVLLPLEFLFASISSQGYPHYYVAWLPVSALLVGGLAARVLEIEPTERSAHSAVWIGALLAAMAVLPVMRTAHDTFTRDSTREAVVAYVRNASGPQDRVLVWGSEPGLNVVSGRHAPTRFAQQYALFMPGYTRPALFAELLDDLTRTPPVLIVDASAAAPKVPPLDVLDGGVWSYANNTVPDGLVPILRLVRERYIRVATIGGWAVYRLRSSR